MQHHSAGLGHVSAAVSPTIQIVAAQLPQHPADRRAAGASGLLLVNPRFEPIYANDAAVEILSYPAAPPPMAGWSAFAQERIRCIVKMERFTTTNVAGVPFFSGRRRYVCRQLLLRSNDRRAMHAVLLERTSRDGLDLSEISRRFRLSRRESETVLHLANGLSTKEVARRMSVSPNTVKQFLRLTMSKMGVSTRVGIVSKIVSGLLAAGDAPFL